MTRPALIPAPAPVPALAWSCGPCAITREPWDPEETAYLAEVHDRAEHAGRETAVVHAPAADGGPFPLSFDAARVAPALEAIR